MDWPKIRDRRWQKIFAIEMKKKYFKELENKLLQDLSTLHYPPRQLVFNAFNMTPWKRVKVVIIGQDPYHNPGQAMGLAFSHPREIGLPTYSCLRNIYKELSTDIGEKKFIELSHGDLSSWAKQGVLLLNTSLTVREKEAGSHSGIGWHTFTDNIIKLLNKYRNHLVFMLWGGHAQEKANLIDSYGGKHLILKTSHPSGLSCNRGFFGSKHFSKCNEYLLKHSRTPIKWESILI